MEGTSQSSPCTRSNCGDGMCIWAYCLHLQKPFMVVTVIAIFLGLGACWHLWKDYMRCPCHGGKATNEPHRRSVAQPVADISRTSGIDTNTNTNRPNNNTPVRPIIVFVPILADDHGAFPQGWNGGRAFGKGSAPPPPEYDPPPPYKECMTLS